VLYVWFLSSFRGGCGSFLSFHRASCSLWNEATKTWSSAPKIRRDEKGKHQRKKERNQLESAAARSHFLYSVWKKSCHLWWSSPLSSFQYPSSIQSLILTIFDSVLDPKKNLSNQPRELGLYPSRGRILDIQMRISWAFDIEIKWFKSPNSSTRLGLKL